MNLKFLLPLALSGLLGGCAGSSFDGYWGDLSGRPHDPGFPDSTLALALVPAFPRDCLTGDVPVSHLEQCGSDGAGCYQLMPGAWCTSATASVSHCPAAAAVPVQSPAACPEGGQCWVVADNLRCRAVYPRDGK